MRKRFTIQYQLGQTTIEDVKIPARMRDELPPVLAGLQWMYKTPEINEQIFQLMEEAMPKKKQTGRPGMDLWHILVLAIVRLTLGCDYDRLEYLVAYDKLLRQIMGIDIMYTENSGKGYHQKTISDNIRYIDEEFLSKLNDIIVKAGLKFTKKKRKNQCQNRYICIRE